MKIPGRRTTTFGFDFDESNESLKEEEAVASPSVLFTPSPKPAGSRKAKRQKISSGPELDSFSSSNFFTPEKRRKSSSKRGSLSKPGGIFGNISATTETVSVPDLSLEETAAYEGGNKQSSFFVLA